MLINFDFDGVIADTLEILLQQCVDAQRILKKGRPPVAEDFRTLENLTFAGLGERLQMPAEVVEQFQVITLNLQKESLSSPRFYTGMVEVIRKLSVHNDLTIVSSSDSQIVRKHLVENGIDEAIKKIMGGETGMSKREAILANISHFSSSLENTYMIGDAVSDIRNGKAAKVKTIGVTWGFQSEKLLEDEDPDILVDTPEELYACLMSQ